MRVVVRRYFGVVGSVDVVVDVVCVVVLRCLGCDVVYGNSCLCDYGSDI